MSEAKRKQTIIITIAILGIMLFIGFIGMQNAKKKTASKSGFYFDTIIQINLYDNGDVSLIDDCFEMAAHYENLFSRTKEDSDIYRINHSSGEPTKVDLETIYLINYGISRSKEIAENTSDNKASFDITIGALSELWNFSESITSGNYIIPSYEDINNAISTIDYKNIVIDEKNNTVKLLNADTKLDLGALAKGYIADKMKAYLNENGSKEGIINLGGNTLTLGAKKGNKKYTIGIQKPFSDDGETITTVQVDDKSIVTSGCYQRYFEVDNTRYHHILDTNTGFPIENDLYSVTVISDSSLEGDFLSTYLFTLGLENGMKYAQTLENINVVFIDSNMKIHTSFK